MIFVYSAAAAGISLSAGASLSTTGTEAACTLPRLGTAQLCGSLHCSLLLVKSKYGRLCGRLQCYCMGVIGHAASGPLCTWLGAAAGVQLLDLCGLHVILMQACSQWTSALFMLLQACIRCPSATLAVGMQPLDH